MDNKEKTEELEEKLKAEWIAKKKSEHFVSCWKGTEYETRHKNPVKYEEAQYLKTLQRIEEGLEKVYGSFNQCTKDFFYILISMNYREVLHRYLFEMELTDEYLYEMWYYKTRTEELTKENQRLKATVYN